MKPGLAIIAVALGLSTGDLKALEGCNEIQNEVLNRIESLHIERFDGKNAKICRQGFGWYYDKHTRPIVVGIDNEGVIIPCEIKDGLLCDPPEGKDGTREKSMENIENFYLQVSKRIIL